MRKIIGMIHPFDIYQIFYVYQDGNKLEIIQTKISDIPDTVLNLSQTYNVINIELFGAEYFAKGIVKQIKEKEITKYNVNKLNIIIK